MTSVNVFSNSNPPPPPQPSNGGIYSNSSNNNNNNNNNNTDNAGPPPSQGGIVAKLLHITDALPETTELGFIATNRVVAVLEKAVERLQLLQLLDTAVVAEEESATGAAVTLPTAGGGGETTTLAGLLASQSTREQSLRKQQSLRAAATYDASTKALFPAVTTAIHTAMTAEDGGRGRPTVSQLVVEQAALEKRYGELLQRAAVVRPPASDPQLPSEVGRQLQLQRSSAESGPQEELRQVSDRLREVNRLLCVQLRDNPNDSDNWVKINNERADLAELLRGAVAELTEGYQASMVRTAGGNHNGNRDGLLGTSYNGGAAAGGGGLLTRSGSSRSMLAQLQPDPMANTMSGTTNNYYDGNSSQPMARKRFGSTLQLRRGSRGVSTNPRLPLHSSFEKLCRTVLQEKAAYEWAEEMVQKEKELNLNVKQLRNDLIKERQLKEQEVAERQRRLGALQSRLRELQKKLGQREEDFRLHAGAATEGQQRRALHDDRMVVEGIEEKERELQEETRSHQLFKAHLQRRTEAAGKLAAEWEQKNAKDIRQVESAKMEAEQERHGYAERLAQCQQDQEALLEKQKERQQFEAERERAVREAEERREREYEAASRLEAALKAMLVRDALEKAGKKKKKGGKKKK